MVLFNYFEENWMLVNKYNILIKNGFSYKNNYKNYLKKYIKNEFLKNHNKITL